MIYRDFIESKIVAEKEDLYYTLGQWRFKLEEIVYVNLTDSVVTAEIVDKLLDASALGTKLVVSIPKDYISQAILLASMLFVDKVLLMDESVDKNEIKDYLQPAVVL
ncbi:MAG: hypothetical protein LBM07_03705 [Culturomica sp.]|jgi:hypothetical protein|nr:hypothetical protein [Culturomica sp.]